MVMKFFKILDVANTQQIIFTLIRRQVNVPGEIWHENPYI